MPLSPGSATARPEGQNASAARFKGPGAAFLSQLGLGSLPSSLRWVRAHGLAAPRKEGMEALKVHP